FSSYTFPEDYYEYSLHLGSLRRIKNLISLNEYQPLSSSLFSRRSVILKSSPGQPVQPMQPSLMSHFEPFIYSPNGLALPHKYDKSYSSYSSQMYHHAPLRSLAQSELS
ncbi:unnamed protein product, partial [Owenia fusiformis]